LDVEAGLGSREGGQGGGGVAGQQGLMQQVLTAVGYGTSWSLADWGMDGAQGEDDGDDDGKGLTGGRRGQGIRPLTSLRAVRAARPEVQRAAAIVDRGVAAVDQAGAMAMRFLGRRPVARIGLLGYLLVLHMMVLWVRLSCHHAAMTAAADGGVGHGRGLGGRGAAGAGVPAVGAHAPGELGATGVLTGGGTGGAARALL
jgi:hypothetical protein